MRMGKKKQPTYRVVAADARSPRNGRFIEIVGTYQPRQDPSIIEIDNDKAVAWLNKGAQPTERVEKLLKISGAWEAFTGTAPDIPAVPEPTPNKGYTAPSPAKPKPAKEEPVAEAPADEAPADEAPTEEAAAADTPADDAPAEKDAAEASTDGEPEASADDAAAEGDES
jgi:small subunit ribosomal protein S16